MGLTFGLALLAAIIAAIFRAEYDACMPWIAERLRRRALRAFKGTIRERLDEEWAAHLQEVPSPMLKVWHGIGFNVAAAKVLAEATRRATLDKVLSTIAFGSVRLAKALAQAGGVFAQLKLIKPVARAILLCFGAPAVALVSLAIRAEYARINLIEDDDVRERMLERFAVMLQNIGELAQAQVQVSEKTEGSGPWG
jgi:hypothetical protein